MMDALAPPHVAMAMYERLGVLSFNLELLGALYKLPDPSTKVVALKMRLLIYQGLINQI